MEKFSQTVTLIGHRARITHNLGTQNFVLSVYGNGRDNISDYTIEIRDDNSFNIVHTGTSNIKVVVIG